jgi:hypothetical protein
MKLRFILAITTLFLLSATSAAFPEPVDSGAHGPGNSACDFTWSRSNKVVGYQQFMSVCLRVFRGEQLPPDVLAEYKTWEKPADVQPVAIQPTRPKFSQPVPYTPQPQPQPQPVQVRRDETGYETLVRIYGEDNTKIAAMRFNYNLTQMIDWLNAQRNIAADRQGGNSYSVRVRQRD